MFRRGIVPEQVRPGIAHDHVRRFRDEHVDGLRLDELRMERQSPHLPAHREIESTGDERRTAHDERRFVLRRIFGQAKVVGVPLIVTIEVDGGNGLLRPDGEGAELADGSQFEFFQRERRFIGRRLRSSRASGGG